jgi:ankyrin repeat protein
MSIKQYNKDLDNGISESDYEMVQKAIKNGANVNYVHNQFNETPLFKALKSRTAIQIMDLLIQNGANVNATNIYSETVLHKACEYEDVESIMYLLRNNVKVNAKNNQGKTPLLVVLYAYIPEEDKLKVVNEFIEKGAKVNVKDTVEYNTPLHLACDSNDIEVVKLLINNGAYRSSKNKYNETPLDIAKLKGHTEIAALLSPKAKRSSKQEPQKKEERGRRIKTCSEITKAYCYSRSKHPDPTRRCKYDTEKKKCVNKPTGTTDQKTKSTPNPEPKPQTKARSKRIKACSEITKAYCYSRSKHPDPTRRCKYDTEKKKCVNE